MQNSIVSPAILPSSGGRGEISSSLSRPFGASLFTARLLEGGDSSGALSQALLRTDGDLGRALFQQGAVFRSDLQRDFGTESIEGLQSLSRERDPQLYFEGLLAIGRDLENHDRLAASARVYGALLNFLKEFTAQNPNTVAWSRSVQDRALQHLQAMRGEGSAGARFEFLSRRLATEASDPALLLGMTAAGLTFRLARVATLSRLASTPTASVLTRGLMPRLLAGSVGLLSESVAFTAGVRGGNALLGRSQEWTLSAVGREWASGGITLLGLRAAGAVSNGVVSRLGTGSGLSLGLARALVPQAGMFAGILLSHRLEARLGLRTASTNATEVTDALATLLQFHVAGALSRSVLGPRWAGLERRLDVEAEALASQSPLFPRLPGASEFLPALAFAGVGNGLRAPRRARAESLSELMVKPLQMAADPNDNKDSNVYSELTGTESANDTSAPHLDAPMAREDLKQLWVTLRMTPDSQMRKMLIHTMLEDARRSPDAVAFLMTARDAEGDFHGRKAVLQQIHQGLRELDTDALREFASSSPHALRALLELGKAGNRQALTAVQNLDYAHFESVASRDAALLVEIASPLRMAFEAENQSAMRLLRGLRPAVVEEISQEAQRSIYEGQMSRSGKAIQLLSVIARGREDGADAALRVLREFPVEIYENADIEDFTVNSLYFMAQAGNETAADLLGSIELYEVHRGSAELLLKLHRYGSHSSLEDLQDLAEDGDLAAVSILHQLGMNGLRAASEFLREMNPANIARTSQDSVKALQALSLIAQHQNPIALATINQTPGMANRLQLLPQADPYELILAVTPEMLMEQHCSDIAGFLELPIGARESISRDIVESWIGEPNKAAYYRRNPTRFVSEDLIPRSYFEPLVHEAVSNYQRASRESPPPRRSETRPSDRPGPKANKRFVN